MKRSVSVQLSQEIIVWVSRNARILSMAFAAATDNVELRVESTLKGSSPAFGMLQEPEGAAFQSLAHFMHSRRV